MRETRTSNLDGGPFGREEGKFFPTAEQTNPERGQKEKIEEDDQKAKGSDGVVQNGGNTGERNEKRDGKRSSKRVPARQGPR